MELWEAIKSWLSNDPDLYFCEFHALPHTSYLFGDATSHVIWTSRFNYYIFSDWIQLREPEAKYKKLLAADPEFFQKLKWILLDNHVWEDSLDDSLGYNP